LTSYLIIPFAPKTSVVQNTTEDSATGIRHLMYAMDYVNYCLYWKM